MPCSEAASVALKWGAVKCQIQSPGIGRADSPCRVASASFLQESRGSPCIGNRAHSYVPGLGCVAMSSAVMGPDISGIHKVGAT